MKSHLSSHRESYNVIPLQEMSSSISIGDGSQIRLQATNVSSVSDRMLTVGRNIKEAGANAASWMANHPLETAILAGGAVLATGSLMLGVGLSAKAAACACSGFASSLTSSNTSGFNTTSNVTANFTTEATSVADFSTTSTIEPTTVLASTLAPCLEPLKVNCSNLQSFSFTIAEGQGFSLKEASENALLLHKKPNTLAYDTEFTVDPKEFCVDGIFSEKAFSLHCDADGKDYLLSAENLQVGETTLATGACAAQTDTIKQYFDCNKAGQMLECKDNAKKACEKVQNFKLTIPPYTETVNPVYDFNVGSVFITEKNKDGKDEHRLFFTNYDKESKNLNVDVKSGCESMLDVPLEFECSGKQSTKIGFTLRQNLTTDGLPSSFNAGACAFQGSTFEKEEKDCNIKFASRSDCGGVLNASSTCQDKMIVLMSGKVPEGKRKDYIELNVLTPENSSQNGLYLIEYVDEASKCMLESSECHIVRRKVKPDYKLRRSSNYSNYPGKRSYVTKIVPKMYNTVDVGYNSLAFSNDTAIPKGYERPCGFRDIDSDKPKKQNEYSVPLCD